MRYNDLNEEFAPYEGAITFDDWSEFIEQCNQMPPTINVDDACAMVGFTTTFFHRVVDFDFDNWRESTSKSILHGISYLKLGQVPQEGSAVFIDLMWQTRFIMMCRTISPTFRVDAKPIIKDGQPIMVKREKALGATPKLIRPANRILRCMYLYWWLNSRMTVKLPKKIYRGIRAHDLYNHDTFKPVVAAIWASDASLNMKRKNVVALLIQWICQRKLHQITDGNILSFTASMPIATYYANGEGFILAVDPRQVEVISSELHDERLQGKDYVSGKTEREYIVRISPEYPFKPADIIISHKDYFIAEMNPLCVSLLDHDDIEASYKLGNVNITARWRWRDNNNGGLVFSVTGDWNEISRREFQKQHGVDPLPTPANLSKIANFALKKRNRAW